MSLIDQGANPGNFVQFCQVNLVRVGKGGFFPMEFEVGWQERSVALRFAPAPLLLACDQSTNTNMVPACFRCCSLPCARSADTARRTTPIIPTLDIFHINPWLVLHPLDPPRSAHSARGSSSSSPLQVLCEEGNRLATYHRHRTTASFPSPFLSLCSNDRDSSVPPGPGAGAIRNESRSHHRNKDRPPSITHSG